MQKPRVLSTGIVPQESYRLWRDGVDRKMSALTAIGLTEDIYTIPLTTQASPGLHQVRTDWALSGQALMEPTGSRLMVTVRPKLDAEISDQKLAEGMLSRSSAPCLTLSVGRLALAGSWRPVILTPVVSGNDEISIYSGTWDLGIAQYSVVLQLVCSPAEPSVWVCILIRRDDPELVDVAPRASVG